MWNRVCPSRLLPVSVLLVLAGVGCGPAPRLPDPDVLAFASLGAEPVGYTLASVTFDNALSGQRRSLPVHVWYPAATDEGPVATYRAVGVISIDSAHARIDAPVKRGELPLIVYSHGSGGDGVLAYEYGERLASHGYLVVAPSHTGNTAGENLFGGARPLVDMLVQRPLDVTGVIDAIERSAEPVFNDVDTDDVVLFGHSFGAYTALAIAGIRISIDQLDFLCDDGADCSITEDPAYQRLVDAGFKDDRVVAIGAQAPAFVEAMVLESYANANIPLLLMSGRADVTTTHEEQALPTWERFDGHDDVWIDFTHAGHQSFVTTCRDLAYWQQDLLLYRAQEDGCGPEQTAALTVVRYSAGAVRRFADLVLRGDIDAAAELKIPRGDAIVQVTARADQ